MNWRDVRKITVPKIMHNDQSLIMVQENEYLRRKQKEEARKFEEITSNVLRREAKQ